MIISNKQYDIEVVFFEPKAFSIFSALFHNFICLPQCNLQTIFIKSIEFNLSFEKKQHHHDNFYGQKTRENATF